MKTVFCDDALSISHFTYAFALSISIQRHDILIPFRRCISISLSFVLLRCNYRCSMSFNSLQDCVRTRLCLWLSPEEVF